MLHPEALLVVDVFLSIFDLHGDIDVGVDQLLRLRDVHFFNVRHVVGHFLN